MTFNSYSTFFILSINMNSITKKQLFQFLSTNNIPFRKSMKKDQIYELARTSSNFRDFIISKLGYFPDDQEEQEDDNQNENQIQNQREMEEENVNEEEEENTNEEEEEENTSEEEEEEEEEVNQRRQAEIRKNLHKFLEEKRRSLRKRNLEEDQNGSKNQIKRRKVGEREDMQKEKQEQEKRKNSKNAKRIIKVCDSSEDDEENNSSSDESDEDDVWNNYNGKINQVEKNIKRIQKDFKYGKSHNKEFNDWISKNKKKFKNLKEIKNEADNFFPFSKMNNMEPSDIKRYASDLLTGKIFFVVYNVVENKEIKDLMEIALGATISEILFQETVFTEGLGCALKMDQIAENTIKERFSDVVSNAQKVLKNEKKLEVLGSRNVISYFGNGNLGAGSQNFNYNNSSSQKKKWSYIKNNSKNDKKDFNPNNEGKLKKGSFKCYGCGQIGHYKRNCPKNK